ncbi:hypothetical protein ACFHYQ_01115 [Sphaerimonospora cavernae]|uniref:VIT family protein n=1 Tax=Sphaerimonospora cavernae TaxID=1740611 RepID=A0ABV6TXF6_9ACTN
MRLLPSRSAEKLLLPFVLGVSDGILNALILAATSILNGQRAQIQVGLRVATVALVTAVFTVYIAEYSELRGQLARASRQLNLTSPGRLAATRLGGVVIREAGVATAVAGLASFFGALIPLLIGAAVPGPSWLPLAVSLLILGVLGTGIGTAVGGSRLRWSCALVIGGVCVTAVGLQLRIL